MTTRSRNSPSLIVVAVFAIAMAWVEAAVVFYLRTMADRIEPYQQNPFPITGDIGSVELGREVATLIMLLTVGILAGKTWRVRLGCAAVAFGIWDIFYYVFLKIMCGWPRSLLDWDILFLLPLPWWGPVLAPILIALLLIAWGILASQMAPIPVSPRANIVGWGMNAIGVMLALFVFMADALRVADQGVDVIRNTLPMKFNWLLFCVALALMSVPIMQLAAGYWRPLRPVPKPPQANCPGL